MTIYNFRNFFYRTTLPCPADGPIAAFFLLVADFRDRLDGRGFSFKPGFPDRAGMPDPAPFPDQRPRTEQGLSHGDGIEPLPVVGGLPPLKVDRGHRGCC